MTMPIKQPIYLLALLLLFTTGLTDAKVKPVTGQLRLMATLAGKPAFKPVRWQITRSPHTTLRYLGNKLNRHTVTLDLEAGTYFVSVSLSNKTKTKKVVIREGKKHFVKISLD